MRRPLVISFLAALIAIGALAMSAGPSTASGAAPAIICPLAGPIGTCCGPPINAPDTTSVLPCCVTGTVCCPGTTLCVVPITVASTPNPSVEGSAVTISGQVTGAAAGTTVVLWQELPGQKTFQKIASATTSSSGAYTLRRPAGKVKTDRAWYVASGGAKSSTIEQGVTAKVTISARAAKVSGGHKITLTGKVDPSHSGQRVLLEERIGGTWRTLGHVRLSKKSHYRVSHTWAAAGVVKLRISLPSDKQNAASVSPVATVALHG
jgi:hypothetical protein